MIVSHNNQRKSYAKEITTLLNTAKEEIPTFTQESTEVENQLTQSLPIILEKMQQQHQHFTEATDKIEAFKTTVCKKKITESDQENTHIINNIRSIIENWKNPSRNSLSKGFSDPYNSSHILWGLFGKTGYKIFAEAEEKKSKWWHYPKKLISWISETLKSLLWSDYYLTINQQNDMKTMLTILANLPTDPNTLSGYIFNFKKEINVQETLKSGHVYFNFNHPQPNIKTISILPCSLSK